MFIAMILIGTIVLSVIISWTNMTKTLLSSLVTALCYLGVLAFVTVTLVSAFRNQTMRT